MDTTTQIPGKYSHLNGEEFLLHQHKSLYYEVFSVIGSPGEVGRKSKTGTRRTDLVKCLHSLQYIGSEIESALKDKGWSEVKSYVRQTYFVKQKVLVEARFDYVSSMPLDLHATSLLLYGRSVINVGVQILPMRAMVSEMPHEVSYFERHVSDLRKHGRNCPAVPLLLVGVST